MSDKTGRKKEEGGHTSIKISINKIIKEALEKLPKGSRSPFIEKILAPVVEDWDPAGSPGPACKYLAWVETKYNEIDDWLNQEIILASKDRDDKTVQALANLRGALRAKTADILEPLKDLCGLPPVSSPKPSDEDMNEKFCEEIMWAQEKGGKQEVERLVGAFDDWKKERSPELNRFRDGRYTWIDYTSLEEVFKQLKSEGFHQVSLDLLAERSGKPPDSLKEEAYRLALKSGMPIRLKASKPYGDVPGEEKG